MPRLVILLDGPLPGIFNGWVEPRSGAINWYGKCFERNQFGDFGIGSDLASATGILIPTP